MAVQVVCCCLFMYTASVMFDYYCRDSELSYIGDIGFQCTPPLGKSGVFNVPEGDPEQGTSIFSMIRTACQPDHIASLYHA